jgi:hypothetical protein
MIGLFLWGFVVACLKWLARRAVGTEHEAAVEQMVVTNVTWGSAIDSVLFWPVRLVKAVRVAVDSYRAVRRRDAGLL